MKKILSLLLAALMVMSFGLAASAEEEKSPIGAVTANVYTNELFGFRMTLPDNWRFLSDTELAGYMGYDQAYASREGLSALLAQQSNVCAMYAAATDDPSANVNFMVEDLGPYQYLEERAYYSLAEESLTQVLQAQGFNDVTSTPQTFLVAGREHEGGMLTGSLGAYQLCMYSIPIKSGKYMGALSIAMSSQAGADQVLSFFEEAEGFVEVLSTSEGQTYENRTFNISLELDQGWHLMDEAERAAQLGLVADSMSSEELHKAMSEALENGQNVSDLNAVRTDGSGDNMSILLSNLGVTGLLVTEEAYFNLAKDQLKEYFVQMGCTVQSITGESVTFCGDTHYGALIVADYSGQPFYERQIYVKSGARMAILTIFSKDQTRLAAMEAMFRPCE